MRRIFIIIFVVCKSELMKSVEPTFSDFLGHTGNMLNAFAVSLAVVTIIVAIATLIVAFMTYKNWMRTNEWISKIEKLEIDITQLAVGISNDKKDNKKKSEFLSKSSECLYKALNEFIANPKTSKLTARLLLQIQESRLFSIEEGNRLSALQLFCERGTKDNLDSITFLAANDESDTVKALANRVIGAIQQRNS